MPLPSAGAAILRDNVAGPAIYEANANPNGDGSAGNPAIPEVGAAGIYNSSPISLSNGQLAVLQFDSAGNLKTTGSSGSSIPTALYLSTLPTLTNNQTTQLLCAANGALLVNPGVYSFAPTQTPIVVGTSNTQLLAANANRKFLQLYNLSPTVSGPGGVTSATTNTSNVITPTAMTNILIGMSVSGTGIPSNSYVTSVGTSTITINNNATATNASVTLTYTGNIDVYVSTDGGAASTDANCFPLAPKSSYTLNVGSGVANTLIAGIVNNACAPVCVIEGS